MGRTSRFAPSPTGLLHRGHAFSALTAERLARESGGRFLLRIEDIDTERCRPDFELSLYEDLAWLGLAWEKPVRRQSEHRLDYVKALDDLRSRGLVYRCFRTRKEVAAGISSAPHGLPTPFVGAPLASDEEAQRLKRGEAYAWRLSLEAARQAVGGFEALSFIEEGAGPTGEHGVIGADPAVGGDVILARKDLGVAYHLAVVVDDAVQGIDLVVRGEDLFEAAHIQRLIQALLGLPTPAYHHHRLLLGPDGKRYAKRDRAQTLAEIRASGVSAGELLRELGFE
ncbi:MAG: glu [Caulobacteraceae bacterium]|nr:glu [Caulobacteraceae bacterium]